MHKISAGRRTSLIPQGNACASKLSTTLVIIGDGIFVLSTYRHLSTCHGLTLKSVPELAHTQGLQMTHEQVRHCVKR